MKISYFLFECKLFLLAVLRYLLVFVSDIYECVYCGASVYTSVICRRCAEEKLLSWIPTFSVSGCRQRCRCCGAELLSEHDICMRCRERPLLVHTEKIVPVHSYFLQKKELLGLWKMQGIRQLSAVFAELAADVLSKEFPSGASIPLVPVPPRPGKIKKKGWDQVDELCRFLKIRYGFTVLPILKRYSRQQQKSLDRVHRLENLGKAYAADTHMLKNCRSIPESAILIDDILTTGVTIETCAGVLKSIGVRKVYACTLFIVR